MYSNATFICLRRDLTQPFGAPAAKIPISVSPIRDGDAARLFDVRVAGLSAAEIADRTARMDLYESGIPLCHVATDPEGNLCYVQWLMSAADNDRLQKYFRGSIPMLAQDYALLEGAFTPESHRGQGIMARAMALIAERAANFGARYVITFVLDTNIPSLKGCKRSGFEPYMFRETRWRFFQQRVAFLPLPKGGVSTVSTENSNAAPSARAKPAQ